MSQWVVGIHGQKLAQNNSRPLRVPIRLALMLCENQGKHKSAREASEGWLLLWQSEQESTEAKVNNSTACGIIDGIGCQ